MCSYDVSRNLRDSGASVNFSKNACPNGINKLSTPKPLAPKIAHFEMLLGFEQKCFIDNFGRPAENLSEIFKMLQRASNKRDTQFLGRGQRERRAVCRGGERGALLLRAF